MKHAQVVMYPIVSHKESISLCNDINMLGNCSIKRGPDGWGLSTCQFESPLFHSLDLVLFFFVNASLNANCFTSEANSLPYVFQKLLNRAVLSNSWSTEFWFKRYLNRFNKPSKETDFRETVVNELFKNLTDWCDKWNTTKCCSVKNLSLSIDYFTLSVFYVINANFVRWRGKDNWSFRQTILDNTPVWTDDIL